MAGNYRRVYENYKRIRRESPYARVSHDFIRDLDLAVSRIEIELDENISILKQGNPADFEILDCHEECVELWNVIVPENYNINDISQIKKVSSELVNYLDNTKPYGEGFTEAEGIQFVTANSSSAFIGIQNPKKSNFAMNSMKSTIKGHLNPRIIPKPWLIDNLMLVRVHIKRHPGVMERSYADICMTARTSSASIRGVASFRDLVLQNALSDIKSDLLSGRYKVPYEIIAGTRSDRRGKYRLICSFDGYFRIVDYLINNGSYALCEGEGVLSKYTTEGYNNERMWPELVSMSRRDSDLIMVCIDYKGYDTQISLQEYLDISRLLNEHRLQGHHMSELMAWYHDWMEQPKSLVIRHQNETECIIPYYRTLASGLHGTHSFENLIGISTMIEAKDRNGIDIRRFWTNGDDQNALISRNTLDDYIRFLGNNFDISWDKSLINHKFAVWGKLWFARDFHPAWEVGTFMSIWQREGGDTNYVEPSKLQSNYCKIVQVAITLIRVGHSESNVKSWINRLSSICGIDPNRIPVQLNNLTVTSKSRVETIEPRGLIESKGDLLRKSYQFKSLSASNYYDMLYNMYINRTYFDLNVLEITYHDVGTTLSIDRNVDYSMMIPNEVPYIFRNLYTGKRYSLKQEFVRDVLQSTNSFDGPSSEYYTFNDMYSLAVSINERNKSVWYKLIRRAS